MNPASEEIVKIVAVQLGRRRVALEDRMIEDLAAESVDVVNIIASIEEQYDIVIDESEIPAVTTVADLVTLVRSRLDD